MCLSTALPARSKLLSKMGKAIYTPSCVFNLQCAQSYRSVMVFTMVVVCLACIKTIWDFELIFFFFTKFQLKYFVFATRVPSNFASVFVWNICLLVHCHWVFTLSPRFYDLHVYCKLASLDRGALIPVIPMCTTVSILCLKCVHLSFLVTVTKHLSKATQRGRICLGSQFKGGESWQQSLEAFPLPSSVRR